MSEDKSCQERIQEQWASTKANLDVLYCPWSMDEDDLSQFLSDQGISCEEDNSKDKLIELVCEERFNYGLSFDYVAPGTLMIKMKATGDIN